MSSNPAIVIGITATDTARGVLQQVDQKIADTATKIDDAGQKVISKTQLMATNFRKSALDIATSAAGLTAGIVGFATSFGSLEKAQTRADQAQITYQKSLDRLNQMQQSGKASAEQLANQQEVVRINAEKAAQAQGDVNDSYTNFLANVPSQMIAFGTSASSIYGMISKNSISTAKTATTSAVEYVAAMQAETIATQEASVATQEFGIVSKLAFMTNPIFIAIAAGATVVALLAFNVGGLRDRVNEFGKAVGDALPFLRPFLEAIGSLQHILGNETPTATQTAQAAITDFTASTVGAGQAVETTKEKIMTLNDYLAEQSSKLADSTHENLLYVESTGKVKDALNLSNAELNRTAEFLRTQQRETEQTTQDNFNLVASTQGLEKAQRLTDTQLQKVADSIRAQQKAAQDTAGAFDKMKDSVNAVKTALETLAEAQQRQVVTQFGMQVGLSGTVSVEALQAAGFGGNADLMASAASGRLGGVFVAGKGRVLDTGGQLYEDVIGIGKDTGTPHLLHKNELVIPPSKISNTGAGGVSRAQPAIIQFVIDSKVIAQATVDDITKLQGKKTRIEAKTYGQRFGVQK